jgi:phage tail-like protein
MPPVYRADPYSRMNFEVVINGISDDGKAVKGSFSEVTGLDIVVEPIEYRTGSEDIGVRKMPGLRKFTNITLKRGVIGDPLLWQWIKTVTDGNVQRANGSVILLDESRQPVMRWNFKRGWPCKVSGPSLNAKSNEVAIESMEICHEGLELD